MPLDLPPPLPPQQAEVAVLEQRNAAADRVIELEVGQYTLLVTGNTYLSEERIRQVTSAGRTPSQVVLLLNALYPADGHILVNVQYAREGQSDTIYVHVNEGYLAEVDAPPAIAPFFESFEGERGLTKQDMEPMRVLAELKSERAGYTMTSSYSVDPANPAAFTLVIDGREDPDHDPFDLTAAFGNPGNRFLGRYFGLANAKYSLDNGDQIGLGYAHGFTGLGSSRGGEKYGRGDLSYSTVNAWGLYGLSGSYTEYEVSGLFDSPASADGGNQLVFQDDRESAEIVEVKLTGNQFLYADEDARWLLEQELAYVDSTLTIDEGQLVASGGNGGGDPILGGLLDGLLGDLLGGLTGGGGGMDSVSLAGQRIQDERYGTARLGTTYSDSWTLFDQRGSLNVGAGYKRGFGGEIENTLTDAERTNEFNLFDASLKTSYRLPYQMLASIQVKGQFSLDDRVPQQQQWVLGGPDNLSAYLPGILVGDTGAYGRFQVQLPRWRVFSRPYRFSVFVETGMAQFEGDNKPFGRADTQRATDAGIKLEFAPLDNIQLTVHAAEGLSESGIPDNVLDGAESDVYFNIKGEF
ncbi:MAG: hypothetical protein RJQ08_16355 [Salinisphaeraceae bacterium]